MNKIFIFTLLSLFGLSQIIAQVNISGQVIASDNEPLIGASILEVGTANGTVTDFEGRFTITVSAKDCKLQFSYTGFKHKTMEFKEKDLASMDSLIVRLTEEVALLDEVAVVGYAPKVKKEARSSAYVAPSRDIAISDDASSKVMIRGISSMDKTTTGFTAETYEEVIYDASSSPSVGAGVLTAGSLNDFQKWDLWTDISEEDLAEWRDIWSIYPKERFVVQLSNDKGFAIIDAQVQLLDNTQKVIWESITDNTGKAELWANINSNSSQSPNSIKITYQGNTHSIKEIKNFQEGINLYQLPSDCFIPSSIDIAFVVDATGSMSDEINYLKAELNNVITRVKDSLPQMNLNLGSIFYRDLTDAYLVRQSPLSSNIEQTITFIKEQSADGGGDTPEAVESALDTAIHQLSWSENAVAKLLFLVLDAPPHQTPEVTAKMKELMLQASKKGIRIIPVACSGTDKSTEYLMRSLALGTNGNYLFLTDDSGIGNPHIEPTTDEYEVKKFNELLLETILQMSTTRSCDDPIDLQELPNDTLIVSTPNPSENEPTEKPQISWKYFPNPTFGLVNIEIEGEVGALYLSDFTGKILERIEINEAQNIQIDISKYPAGTYYLKYQYGKDDWLSGKLILVHS